VILLDTHTWVWWVSEPRKLSRAARKAIDGASRVGVSAISAWEIAMKISHGKLHLDRSLDQWFAQALAFSSRIRELPIDTRVAHVAGILGEHGLHGDPADRFLAATARLERIPLVTKDRNLRASSIVNTVW
jgi:PIN domain nuclease of toxin-antitoxin system